MASKGTGRHGLIGGGDKGNGTISQGSRDLTLSITHGRAFAGVIVDIIWWQWRENETLSHREGKTYAVQ